MTMTRRSLAIIIAGASAIALGTAYGSQYLGGLHPCILCLYQRIPYWVVLGLGIIAVLPVTPPRLRIGLLALCGLAFLVGAGIAGFHHGVEQQWWEGTSECSAKFDTNSFESFRDQILNNPIVRCDDIPWSLFGLSMASYNFIASLILALFTFVTLGRLGKGSVDD